MLQAQYQEQAQESKQQKFLNETIQRLRQELTDQRAVEAGAASVEDMRKKLQEQQSTQHNLFQKHLQESMKMIGDQQRSIPIQTQSARLRPEREGGGGRWGRGGSPSALALAPCPPPPPRGARASASRPPSPDPGCMHGHWSGVGLHSVHGVRGS